MKHVLNNATKGLTEPWIAYKEGVVYYMPKESIPDYDIQITYNVTDISAPTKLFATYGSQAYLTEMSIDGGEYNVTASTHQFGNVGEHTVRYKVDNSFTSFTVPLFYQVNATKVIIADSVTYIGHNAFHSCVSLTSVTIGSGVTSIGGSAFSNCSSLTSVTIPNSVTRIDTNAFGSCTSLTSVTIPNSVTSIGNQAFYNCSSLTSVTYNGTTAQWNTISKGSDWKYNVPSTCLVHCTDGDIPINET